MEFALATFAAVLALVLVPYFLFVVRPERGAQHAVQERLKTSVAGRTIRPELLLTELPLSSVPVVDSLLRQSRLVTRGIQRRITQAGLKITVGTVILASLFLALVTAAAVSWLTHMSWLAALLGVASGLLPTAVVNMRAARRLRAFEEQFPEAVELVARALRAGHAFTTGLSMVSEELPDPVSAEFRLLYDRQAFGMPIADALRDMAMRVALLDARFFVTAVLTQRESGGNLSEVLDNLASLMRERFTLKRQVRTLSAHGRITASVLVGLAPAVAAALTLIMPAHMKVLIADPMGQAMVTGAVFLQLVGILVIRRIVNIEV